MKLCGEKNINYAIIISAGFSESGANGAEIEASIIEIAKRYNIKLIGPNCLGVLFPHNNLNATFTNSTALPGNLALISQSGALCAAILDWAASAKIGFSALVSLGNIIDIDFGDVLDFLALDPKTHSILLYIESIRHPRKFISSLRAAAKLKPVIIIKAGRNREGIKAAISHTAALVGSDDAFNAAIKRAGAVRVNTIEELFSAGEILSKNFKFKGDKLVIITNGGGAGVLAADHAFELKIKVPEFKQETVQKFNALLPKHWSAHNPLDILGDATPELYEAVITACLEDEAFDAILGILVPVVTSDPLEVAKRIVEIAKNSKKPILTSWLGMEQVASSRKLFLDNDIATFDLPETALDAFSFLAEYYHNQQLLLQAPVPFIEQTKSDISGARYIIEDALAENRKVLTTIESKGILSAFGIPVTQTITVNNVNDALINAELLGFPLVMKILSPDITHKQEVSGIELNITTAEGVRRAYHQILDRLKQHRPDARITGVTLERMYINPNNRELMIGVAKDPVFGPVISFGLGGSFVEVIGDKAVALLPLNPFIIKQLIARTRASRALGKFRNLLPANMEALENVLMKISEMICEIPQIQEMDINPMMVNNKEAVAVDARIVVDFVSPALAPYSHLAIDSYV